MNGAKMTNSPKLSVSEFHAPPSDAQAFHAGAVSAAGADSQFRSLSPASAATGSAAQAPTAD
jgi:hypothetical protein